ncbi:CinA family nicotinamide mononucleotide deamidase-related protein [Thalassomonas actiniarum]|uniref:CinA-like protein n=1 Tax=Thalassomonas actiniarum TaxID=485447 RepID=A0AAE9YQW2_9GAMM|nr:CinA family nicotinamide mononucleotide deamidase-related protein [Thalassomonas actiniarum]WDD97931.1 CinA family nicotinamide mononucleotide deamidase-related protein [Thalassomonas actiniarum]
MKQIKVQLLLTGNELLNGDVVDTNSAMIARELAETGIEIKRKVTVSDDLSLLVAEIGQMSTAADVLIINGGLGPTTDDFTAQALAQAMNVPLAQHQQAYQHLVSWCQQRDTILNPANLKQALLPQGCDIIANRIGSAVGFKVRHNNCEIYCTPGVPAELKVMLEQQILPDFAEKTTGQDKTQITKFQIFGLGESKLQQLIHDELAPWPDDVELGFRAGDPLLELKLTTRSSAADAEKAQCITKLKALLGNHIVAEINGPPKSLAQHVLDRLTEKGQTLATAESCTGGLIASLLTQVPGSSQAFEAGFVTYSNDMKSQMLGVDPRILANHGAVSRETIQAMAEGALERSAADYVIAVSGVAGPGGGSKEKPVGTVWLAWGSKTDLKCHCFLIPGTRLAFQRYVAAIGLDLIRRSLNDCNDPANYLIERSFK